MTDPVPSKELTPISEVISELRLDLGNADAGPWEIYTSNSYRRVGLAGTYKAVVYPVVHKDGQPDIAGFENLRAMVESFNAAPRLIAEIDRLNGQRCTDQQLLFNYECEIDRLNAELTESRDLLNGEWFNRVTYKQQLRAALARIDALMIEHCPNEMTQQQRDNWAAHQRAAQPPRDGQ